MTSSYLSIPLKKASELDLVKPLKNFISVYYSTADEPVDCSEALSELNRLRVNATWRTLDKHESSLEVMYRYYDQLSNLEMKCPPNDIQIPFKWRDALDKGSMFGGYSSLTVSSLSFERVCILFNIAAMQSQVGSSLGTDITNDDALKSAAKHFQQASGIFQSLKHTAVSCIQQDPTPDLQPDTLSALQSLMLAQAQESFFHKAVSDKMKDMIIAKVSYQCYEFYEDAMKQMQKEHVKTLFEKEWMMTVSSKQAAFQAIAEYHQSAVCKAKKDVGEELARLQHALELIKTAETRGGYVFSFKDYINRITRAHEEARKDNDFIYHARIPDVKNLTPIGKATLAKPLPVPDRFNPSNPDLFGALLPVQVQNALHAFDVRKTELINGEIAKLRDATQVMNGILSSLNLPAAVEDTTGNSLPQSMQDKAEAVKAKGGVAVIQQLVSELPTLLQRNKEIMDECERLLNGEEQADIQLKNNFAERWTRTASKELNSPLRATAAKYRTIINTAIDADRTVQEKYRSHKERIELLSMPLSDIEASVPSGSPASSLGSSASVQQLRMLMEQLATIRAERDVIESELKDTTLDIKGKFISALAEDGALNETALSVECLGEAYAAVQKQARENIQAQEKTMAEVQTANLEFCKEKSTNQSAAQRETVLSELAASHDAYMELVANLQEGSKFYNDLTQLLVNFQNKINDYCFARNVEKEELVRALQQAIVNRPTEPTPTPPTHHVATTAAGTQGPPRPPPPTTAPTSAPPTSSPAAPAYSPYQGVPVQAANQPHPQQPLPQQLPYPVQFQGGFPYQPQNVPMPTGYNPYMGQVPAQYPTQGGYNPYVQYPPAPQQNYYGNYPQQQWRQ